MFIARRLYIYATSFISLMMLVGGLSYLLKLLMADWLATSQSYYYISLQDQYSQAGAITVVGGVVWLIHWILAQRSARAKDPHGIEERQSGLRKLMLYLTLFVTAIQVFTAAGRLLGDILLLVARPEVENLKYSLTDTIPVLLVNAPVWLYFWLVTRADNRIAADTGYKANVRRLYFYLMNYGAVTALIISVAILGQQCWQFLTSGNDSYYRYNNFLGVIAPVIAWIIVSLLGWLWHWWQVQRLNATSEEEQHSLLRKFYLYYLLFQTITVTITAAAFFLFNLMRLALNNEAMKKSSEPLLTQVGNPLVVALAFGIFWGYHALVLHRDMELVAQEPPLQANLRRLYWYLLSLVGFVALTVGIARLLRIMLDLGLGGSDSTALKRTGWGDEISLLITIILVGGAVWFYSWLKLQRQSLAQEHAEERRSTVRRIYLYLVLFYSVVVLLISGATLIYLLLRNIGSTFTSTFTSSICWALGITLTAGLWLVYHLWVLLKDQKANKVGDVRTGQAAVVAEFRPEVATLVFIRGRDTALIAGKIAQLQRQLPADYTIESLPAANLNLDWLRASLAGQTQNKDSGSAESGL